MMRNVNCDESRNLWTRKETFVSGRPATRIRRKYRKIEEFQCTIALTLCDHSELFLHTFYAISFTQIKTKIALQMGVKEYYFYLDSADPLGFMPYQTRRRIFATLHRLLVRIGL